MVITRLIQRKRDGGRLVPAEWDEIVRAYAAGSVPDYQMSALLMATYIRGLDDDEIIALTDAMLATSARFELSHLGRPCVDKHSTGGVGDKISLVLAPLMASLGVAVPMISGRGLGHTGGTLDKLEAIPGFRTRLSLREATAQIESLHCALIGQTEEFAPADRGMYALRDATGTVESIPLIAASIMSKKLAESLSGLVLDIKRGSGSFLPALEAELTLARTMISLGDARGCPVVALITAMDRPLGHACGNALEVEEAIQTLRGEGPHDVTALTYALGAEMLVLGKAAPDRDSARRLMEVAISSGKGLERFRQIIEAQGGDPHVIDEPGMLPQAERVEIYEASRRAVVAQIEPRAIGEGVVTLGGGRRVVADVIDPSVGFVIPIRPGDVVQKGEPIASIYARDDAGILAGRAVLDRAIVLGEEADHPLPLISHRVTSAGVERWAD